MTPAWRAMTSEDLDRVVQIAAIGFPDHFEARDCFENRLALWPQGCFVLAQADRVEAYLVAYPWRAGTVPPLNAVIATVPADATVLYLHDLALTPEVRGQGWSRPAMRSVLDLARAGGWPVVALVAVNDAVDFWRGHGFAVCEAPGLADKLSSYGPDARYMTRPA